MTGLAVLARVALAAAFGLAGASKLAGRDAAEDAAIELGAPMRAARAIVVALSVIEIALAVLLLVPATARAAALGAALLALGLTAVVAKALAEGRRPACRCFGALSDGPIGRHTIVRNLVLAGTAGALAIWGGSEDPFSWLSGLEPVDRLALAVAALAAAVTALSFALMRAHGRLLLRVDALEGHSRPRAVGPPVGEPVPPLDLPVSGGGHAQLEDLLGGAPKTMLLFTDARCGPCVGLLPDVARWQRDLADELNVALVSSGPPEDVRALADEHGLANVLLDTDADVARAYGITGTPSALLVSSDGRAATPAAAGSVAITALAEPMRVVEVG